MEGANVFFLKYLTIAGNILTFDHVIIERWGAEISSLVLHRKAFPNGAKTLPPSILLSTKKKTKEFYIRLVKYFLTKQLEYIYLSAYGGCRAVH